MRHFLSYVLFTSVRWGFCYGSGLYSENQCVGLRWKSRQLDSIDQGQSLELRFGKASESSYFGKVVVLLCAYWYGS